MSVWAHVKQQPFVTATAIAALAHSTWSLGTLFSGVQPMPPELGAALVEWVVFAIKTLAWHLPAFAIAFAFDVGQVATAAEIRKAHAQGKRPWRKYLTFVVFAAATFYLQMLYAAVHLPALALGAGVSAAHNETVRLWLDAAVWVIPAFLPLSTLLYTFSSDDAHSAPETAIEAPQTVSVSVDPAPRVEKPQRPAQTPQEAIDPTGLLAPVEAPALPAPVAELLTELEQMPVVEAEPTPVDDQPTEPIEWTPLPPVALGDVYADADPLPFDAVPGKATVKGKPKTPPATSGQQSLF